MPAYIDLFTVQAANGNSASVGLPDGGAEYTAYAWGGFAGGTITIYVSPDNGTTWISTAVTFAAAGKADLKLNATHVRATLAGAGAATLNLRLFRGGNT